MLLYREIQFGMWFFKLFSCESCFVIAYFIALSIISCGERHGYIVLREIFFSCFIFILYFLCSFCVAFLFFFFSLCFLFHICTTNMKQCRSILISKCSYKPWLILNQCVIYFQYGMKNKSQGIVRKNYV